MSNKNFLNFFSIILGICFLLSGMALVFLEKPSDLAGFVSKFYSTHSTKFIFSPPLPSSKVDIHQTKINSSADSVGGKMINNSQKSADKKVGGSINKKDGDIDKIKSNPNDSKIRDKKTQQEPSSKTGAFSTVIVDKKINNVSQSLEETSSGLDQLIKQVNQLSPGAASSSSISSKSSVAGNSSPLSSKNKNKNKNAINYQGHKSSLSFSSSSLLTISSSKQEDKGLEGQIKKTRKSILEAKNQVNQTMRKQKIVQEAMDLSIGVSAKSNRGGKNSKKSENNQSGKISGLSANNVGNQNKKSFSSQDEKEIIKKVESSQPAPVIKKVEMSAHSAQKLARRVKKLVVANSNISREQKEKIISLSNRIEQKAKEIDRMTQKIKEKPAVNLAQDSDNDGLSDFAEAVIYHTDPNNSDTDGDGLSDGEELKNGFNPTKAANDKFVQKLQQESPKKIKIVKPHLLQITHIGNVIVTDPATQQKEKKIVISGKSLPDIYLAVYVYSNPIVAIVKTDSEGNWQLTLDNRLDDGSHEVYIALSNGNGDLIARAEPQKFLVNAGMAITEEELQRTASIYGFPWASLIYYVLASLIILVGGILIIMTTKKSYN